MKRNKTFVSYQRRDNPHCNYGMTGILLPINNKANHFIFHAADKSTSFVVKPSDVFTYGKPIKNYNKQTNFTSISG